MPPGLATRRGLRLRPAEPAKVQVQWWYQARVKLVVEANYRSPTPATALRCLAGLVSQIRFQQFALRACHSFSRQPVLQEAPAGALHLQILRATGQSVSSLRCSPGNLAAGESLRCNR